MYNDEPGGDTDWKPPMIPVDSKPELRYSMPTLSWYLATVKTESIMAASEPTRTMAVCSVSACHVTSGHSSNTTAIIRAGKDSISSKLREFQSSRLFLSVT